MRSTLLFTRFGGLILTLIYFNSFSQTIVWNSMLRPTDRVQFYKIDSLNQFNDIYNVRQFLYDSLRQVAAEKATTFSERLYIAEFAVKINVRQIILVFPNASRFVYYIKLYDETGNDHVVYEYTSKGVCQFDPDVLTLTIAPTSYKVSQIEIGTFQEVKTIARVGVSSTENVNAVINELLVTNYTNICTKVSFLTNKERLAGSVNSDRAETKPIITVDGTNLIFHRQNHEGNVGGKSDDQDIYWTTFKNGQWAEARNTGSPLNNKLPNGIASVAPGENIVYLINEYTGKNSSRQGISYSLKRVDGWNPPQKLEVENFYNRSPYFDFCISSSQGEMILAMERDDSWGDQDLYVSFYDDNSKQWLEPTNIGIQINTPLAETAPYLAADGRTLYFASEGHLGYGGFDLYMTKRLDDTWVNWSAPENLGSVINSDNDDLYYSISALGDYAYFISGVENSRDIYRIPLPKIYKPRPVVLVEGNIFSARTAELMEAEIKVTKYATENIIATTRSSELDGSYKLVLPLNGLYDIHVSKTGYRDVKETISTLNINAYCTKSINWLLFGEEQAVNPRDNLGIELSQKDGKPFEVLDKIANFCKHFPKTTLSIYGLNESSISSMDAYSIVDAKQYLVQQNVADSAIQLIGDNAGSVFVKMTMPEQGFQIDARDIAQRDNEIVNEDNVTHLVNGKVIDGFTLKPLAAQIAYLVDKKIISRTFSNPTTGLYQVVLPAGSPTHIRIIYAEKERIIPISTVNPHVVIPIEGEESAVIMLGSKLSINLEEKDFKRWNKKLKRKKTVKEYFYSLVRQKDLHPDITNDLIYLSEILKANESSVLRLFIYSESDWRNKEMYTKRAKELVQLFLLNNGITEDRLEVLCPTSPRPDSKRAKHYSNTSVLAQIIFKKP